MENILKYYEINKTVLDVIILIKKENQKLLLEYSNI